MTTATPECAITVTLDVEDHRPDDRTPARYAAMTDMVLERLAERGMAATVFVVGELAWTNAALVRRIAAGGHEIGLHSYDHAPLTRADPADFGRRTADAKARLEDVAGRAVTGYRAPSFSLTAGSRWCVDVLAALGFTYSSSVLPAANPIFGDSGAPARPFRWPAGLVEFPVPVARLGPLAVPYLGGIYFRYLPAGAIRRAAARAPGEACLWTYLHPYDFDADEPFVRPHGAALWKAVLLWANRRGTAAKLERLLDRPEVTVAPPLADRLAAGAFADAPVFPPDGAAASDDEARGDGAQRVGER